METELNSGLDFLSLTKKQQASFIPFPVPVLVKFEAWNCVYKWTDYGTLANPKTGEISEYWFPWNSFTVGSQRIDGFKEFRVRHRNDGGSVGRPQQAARALAAVTEQWGGMSAVFEVCLGLCRKDSRSTQV